MTRIDRKLVRSRLEEQMKGIINDPTNKTEARGMIIVSYELLMESRKLSALTSTLIVLTIVLAVLTVKLAWPLL